MLDSYRRHFSFVFRHSHGRTSFFIKNFGFYIWFYTHCCFLRAKLCFLEIWPLLFFNLSEIKVPAKESFCSHGKCALVLISETHFCQSQFLLRCFCFYLVFFLSKYFIHLCLQCCGGTFLNPLLSPDFLVLIWSGRSCRRMFAVTELIRISLEKTDMNQHMKI